MAPAKQPGTRLAQEMKHKEESIVQRDHELFE
jgi:hypothetical protein